MRNLLLVSILVAVVAAVDTGETVDILEKTSRCRYEDSFTRPMLRCNITLRYEDSVDKDFVLACDSSSSTASYVDVADQCVCNTADPCSCAVCPTTGDILVDCGQPLVDSCTLVDCNATCNGSNTTEIITAQPTEFVTAKPTKSPVVGPPGSPAPTTNSTGPPSGGGTRRIVSGGVGLLSGAFLFISYGGVW